MSKEENMKRSFIPKSLRPDIPGQFCTTEKKAANKDNGKSYNPDKKKRKKNLINKSNNA
jgi:hypothetical protein